MWTTPTTAVTAPGRAAAATATPGRAAAAATAVMALDRVAALDPAAPAVPGQAVAPDPVASATGTLEEAVGPDLAAAAMAMASGL